MPVLSVAGAVDLLPLAAIDSQSYPCLLETPGPDGWDILFACPQSVRCYPADAGATFLEDLEDLTRGPAVAADGEAALPFRGGWFLYLGYELLHSIEPSVIRPAQAGDFPLAALMRIPAAILVERPAGRTHFLVEPGHEDLLPKLQSDLAAARFIPAPVQVTGLDEEPPQRFLAGVERILDYIRAGDVFQVNLARRWQATWPGGDAASLYAALRKANPAPFGGLMRLGTHAVVSSSPERLVRVSGRRIETRPIAGTHPRSADAAEDAQLKARLVAHPKERAEHIMLVDLERNDLGRLCRPGSVRVDELMAVETYAHVHHIESVVSGELRAGISAADIVRALFPGGTITGCPKVRTLQLIAELESSPRQAYTGSFGYLNHDGSLDLNILIRSFMLEGEQLGFKAGAGIVADSDPLRELQETRAKAKGLLRALGTDPDCLQRPQGV